MKTNIMRCKIYILAKFIGTHYNVIHYIFSTPVHNIISPRTELYVLKNK